MNCSRVQLLLAEYVTPAIRDPAVDWEAVASHLRTCPACAAQAAKMRRAVRLVQSMPEVFTEPARQEVFLGEGPPGRSRLPAAGLTLPQDSPHGRASSPSSRLRWLLRPAAALAACLAVSVLAWALSAHLRPAPMGDSGAGGSRTGAASSGLDGLEVIGSIARLDRAGTPGTQRMVRAGEALVADRQQLALRIWDRHEVRLEPGTRLTPHWGQDGGCLLRLSAGQIRVAVNRRADEGIFRIVTPHADIAVTGTILTVTATGSTTYLHVTQGTVEMTPQHGRGHLVSAGAVVSTQGVEVAAVSSDDLVTVLAAVESTVDLTEAIKESRWYRQRFAPLLYLHDYLEQRGVEVDELELLAISADLWCLQYPAHAGADLPAYIHRKAGLERAAQWCGYRVEWLTPSSAAEAAELVADGVQAGDLVLAYGLAGQAVTALGPEGSADAAASSEWRYRFLAEPTPTAFPMCRIGPSERPVGREQLIDQAVADVRSLLTETHDREYRVGRQAIESWSQACGRTNQLRLADPLLRSLTTIAQLAGVCEDRLSGSAIVGRPLGWTAAAAELADAVQSAFAASAFEATQCGEIQRRELTSDLVRTIEQLAEERVK